ncbi:hypothetical protein [Ekhidna sp.]|uniref:hypothetical protein n=1 Tax=Ekhidna sp. TaxID=2608089 RepID=UPI00329A68EA
MQGFGFSQGCAGIAILIGAAGCVEPIIFDGFFAPANLNFNDFGGADKLDNENTPDKP